VWADRTIIEC